MTDKKKAFRFVWEEALEKDARVRPATRAVLLTMARYADFRTGENMYPSLNRLADNIGTSRRHVTSQVAIALELGWIKRTGERDGGTNIYRLSIPDHGTIVPTSDSIDPGTIVPMSENQSSNHPGTIVPPPLEPEFHPPWKYSSTPPGTIVPTTYSVDHDPGPTPGPTPVSTQVGSEVSKVKVSRVEWFDGSTLCDAITGDDCICEEPKKPLCSDVRRYLEKESEKAPSFD